ncbi:MAG: HAMP domain-containing sensor histidine kinase [Candidatus Portnoybacteria bacterium]|nr:HAMP domain-containing sensor histidine kinase [Candidatus Portnoybacteria bacterium]
MEQTKKGFGLFKECRQYNISLWQCPSFLFFILGALNIGAMVSTYFISTYYTDEPEITALLTIIVSLLILIIGTTVVQGFDRLLETSRMKTEFVRIVSHQLRTPLSSLRWSLDVLMREDSNASEEQMEYLNIIKENNARMLKLINDLLDVTRIEMGSMGLEIKPSDLKKIIAEVVHELAPLAKASNILFENGYEKDLPPVFVDPEKIKIAITNLVENAVKYTLGGGKVKICAEKENKNILISVSDNGVGIPFYQQKNIFNKFFRSDNVIRHQTVGTGLGLFIVKAIVEAHRGRVWFKSQEGKGSTFYFRIPIDNK